MSGCYKGLQNRIKEQNPLAHYIPCAAHSLQLVGSAAAESSAISVEYFALEQQIYNFFHSSTQRWDTLLSHYDKHSLTVKSLSKTRWSARADASKAMHKCYQQIVAALQDISSNEEDKKEVRLEAKQLIEKLQSLEITIMICFWNEILTKFQDVSLQLQYEDGDLDQTALLYELLESSLSSLRNEEHFSIFESKASLMCNSQEYKQDKKRKKKQKMPFGESKEGHTEFDGRKSFVINCYFKAIDTLLGHLTMRKSIYITLRDSFNYLWNLNQTDSTILKEKATKLMNEYSTDLDESFPDECLYFQRFLKDSNTFYEEENVLADKLAKEKKMKPPGTKAYRLLKHLKTLKLESLFPNVEVALRIFLSMAVTNCSGERSFSALTRVKNFLRSTLRQEKLQALALLFIESDYVQLVPIDDLINAFASSKARKKDFNCSEALKLMRERGMVQEFHVLKCYSCEHFQSHIVKKTNKWECKVCGAKQSIKKVYGRGSGKDCRIHTQKLNLLKGEKDDQKHVNNTILEEDKERSLLQSDLQQAAQPCNEHPTPTSRPSRWEVFLDKDNSNELRSNCKIQGSKRKRSFDISESNRGEEYDIKMEQHDSVDNIYSDLSYSRSGKYLEGRTKSTYQNEICRNSLVLKISSMTECETADKHPVLKLNKLINKKSPSKVSIKWSKYIDQDEMENKQCLNTNRCEDDIVGDLFDLNASVIKKAGVCREVRSSTLKVHNMSGSRVTDELILSKDETLPVFEQTCELAGNFIKRADFCREVRDCTLEGRNLNGRSVTDEFILSKNETLPVFEHTCELAGNVIKRADFCREVRDCTLEGRYLNGRSVTDELILSIDETLPVFEQTRELNDNDFLLDF